MYRVAINYGDKDFNSDTIIRQGRRQKRKLNDFPQYDQQMY